MDITVKQNLCETQEIGSEQVMKEVWKLLTA